MQVRYSLSPLVLMMVAAVAPLAAQQGTFTTLGVPNTNLTGISADGSIAVGSLGSTGPAFRWTASTGVVNIGGFTTHARISRDGSTITAEALNAQGLAEAAIWQGNREWKTLGNFGGFADGVNQSVSTPYSVSRDGKVIVGLSRTTSGKSHAFRWEAATGMVDLGALQGQSSRANAVSADGEVIVGWDDNPLDSGAPPRRGAMWWQGIERLMHPFGWTGEALATNDSGTTIVGYGHPSASRHAYLWTAWGTLEDLGSLRRSIIPSIQEEEDRSVASAVSDNASVVVGLSGYKPPTDAIIWTAETKMVKLSDYLKGRGIKVPEDFTLVVANSVSPDGKILAGVGLNAAGALEGWIAKLQ